MDTPSNGADNNLKKRALRARRGGPGVGSSDVDAMILDTQRRKPENDPLIPASTSFFLTTSPNLLPPGVDTSSTNDGLGFNLTANERYFDRPEVLRAYREQQIIETPELVNISDTASVVGGRFRPRGQDNTKTDTSDAAYEKRHKKYETFERRLRAREKEKLKHEQYKLKERIEQLRALDGSAFLGLPSSSFTPPPISFASANDDEDTLAPPSGHTNGAVNGAHGEGERRRREMLDIATGLEERYRILLPPEKGSRKSSSSAAHIAEQERQNSSKSKAPESGEEVDELDLENSPTKESEKLKLKIKTSSKQRAVSEFPSSTKSTTKMRSRSTVPAISPLKKRKSVQLPPPQPVSPPLSPMSNPEIVVLHPQASSPHRTIAEDELINDSGPPRKRQKTSFLPKSKGEPKGTVISRIQWQDNLPGRDSLPPIASISAPVVRNRSISRARSMSCIPNRRPGPSASHTASTGTTEFSKSLLVVVAKRTSNARLPVRHLQAFGFKVPDDVDVRTDYKVPAWIHDDEQQFVEAHMELQDKLRSPGATPTPPSSLAGNDKDADDFLPDFGDDKDSAIDIEEED